MMPDTPPEKPKRDSDKRKGGASIRWQILLIAGIVVCIAVWGMNAAMPTRPIGWWITATIEAQSTYQKSFELTPSLITTAIAATDQAATSAQFDRASKAILATQTVYAPTRMMLFATADAFFAPENTALAETRTYIATNPPDIDKDQLTATMFVIEVTQLVYVYQLETQAALTANDTSNATPEAKNR
jgi:hypothetical protein